ncbi:hypothetical protein ACFQX7_37465 [Luedemannella flava]
MPALPDRADLVTMLAGFGDRRPEAVTEELDSLELAWLVHQVEQRYAVRLDLDDEALLRMVTITDALTVFRDALAQDEPRHA